MPIVVLLDTSFSMQRNVLAEKSAYLNGNLSRIQLAKHGVKTLFEFLQSHNKFELTALMTFSRNCQVISQFTRDYEMLKNCLSNIQTFDKASLIQALLQTSQFIKNNYNSELFYHILLITDGDALLQSYIVKKNISLLFDEDKFDLENLHFPPKCKIHIVCVTTTNDLTFKKSLYSYQEIITKNCKKSIESSIEPNVAYDGGQIWVPDVTLLSQQVIEDLFLKICNEHFKAYKGKIICGNLSGLISLYPNLTSKEYSSDIEVKDVDLIKICGFLNADEMSDPPVFSRHYVMAVAEKNIEELKKWVSFINAKSDLTDEEIGNMFNDESRQPSFAVLLHGSFKIINMVALCEIGTSRQWYGILHSVSEKKKSNLMLYTFKPGLNSVPWIPNFHHLSLIKELTNDGTNMITNNNILNTNKVAGKKTLSSYAWLQQQSVQNDIQKVFRFIKKLPDKFDQLCSEINRIHRAAIAFQFFDLNNALIEIFENDPRHLLNSNQPEVRNQIEQILKVLRNIN